MGSEGFKNTRCLFLTCPRSTPLPPQSHVMWWAPKKGQTKGFIYIFERVGGCRNKNWLDLTAGSHAANQHLIYCQNHLYAFNSGRSSPMVLNRLIHPTLTGLFPVQVLLDHIRRRSDPAQTPNSNCSAAFWSSVLINYNVHSTRDEEEPSSFSCPTYSKIYKLSHFHFFKPKIVVLNLFLLI